MVALKVQRKQLSRKDRAVYYQSDSGDCRACAHKAACTRAPQRLITRHLYDDVLQRMNQRVTPGLMRLRRCVVEHPFAALKYHIFGHPRLLLRGLKGAKAEISLAFMAYSLKRMVKLRGAASLTQALQPA